jgi:HSP20 family protein
MARFPAPFGASRTPARWGDPFVNLQREVNRVFDDVFRGFGVGPSDEDGMAAPRIDIDETDQAIQVTAELPGVKMEEMDVSIEGDLLTIRGEKRCERTDERALVSERFYGKFQRSVQLPFTPSADAVQASFENGVLKISVPRTERSQKARKIEVRSGAQGKIESAQAAQGGAMPGNLSETAAHDYAVSGGLGSATEQQGSAPDRPPPSGQRGQS